LQENEKERKQMSDLESGDLVISTNLGRYSIADAQYGPDLTGGTRIEVEVADRWLGGIVEHSSSVEVGYYAMTPRQNVLALTAF